MADSIIVRQVQEGDEEALRDLLEKEAQHGKFTPDESDFRHPANASRTIVGATLDPENINCGWIALCNGVSAGLIRTEDLGGGVFVDSNFRRKGIAEALVKAREDYFFNELGYEEIRRPVRADNEGSIKLHRDKLGYAFDRASQELLEQNPPGETVLYLVKQKPDIGIPS